MPIQTPALPSASILGLRVHDITMEEALNTIDAFIQSGRPHHVVTADASMFVTAQGDPALFEIVRDAELVTPDSVGILWAARRLGRALKERVSGVEIVERLCARSPERGHRLFFFGAAPNIAELAADRMRTRYPGASIVGTRNGFFAEADIPAIIAEIREARPDILCVALGIPKQEKWIASHRECLGVPVLIGVGGTFDVLSGTVRRAPVLFQKLRVEWLWRLLSNPRKISKVMLLPRFVQLILKSPRKD